MNKQTFHRDRLTWLAYFMLAFFGYLLNIFGPITPFLMDELHLSYTISSLHTSAFACGILIIGLVGNRVIALLGRRLALWVGAFGMSTGALLLVSVRSPFITIPASFLMGLIGSLILIMVSTTLSDRHGEYRSVALSEANVVASFVSALAPLIVGWTAATSFGWRLSLVGAALLPALLIPIFGSVRLDDKFHQTRATPSLENTKRKLPPVFWVYWTALVLAVSIEFCMIFWSADFLEKELGLPQASAAQAVSLFLGGMILGRLAGSILVRRMKTEAVIFISVALTAAGFLLYWTAVTPQTGLPGLFLAGLGTASLYPLILSLAIGSAGNLTVEASSRGTLASGTAILLLPLILGTLADSVGIRWAYGIILLLLLGVLVLIQLVSRSAFFVKTTHST